MERLRISNPFHQIGWIFLTTFILWSCGLRPAPTPIPKDTSGCSDACTHLRKLGCPEGFRLKECRTGSPQGACPEEDLQEVGPTCEEFCAETQQSGHQLNPECISGITACAEIESCGPGALE